MRRLSTSCVIFTLALSFVISERIGLRIHVVTWNVNSKKPPDDMSKLLGQVVEDGAKRPDMVVVGLQEVAMDPYKVVVNSVFGNKWSKEVHETLAKNYVKVRIESMVSVELCIYILRDHSWSLEDVSGFEVPTGLAGLYGNKGGVVVSFRLHGSLFTFINAHLPASERKFRKRIEAMETILSRVAQTSSPPQDFLFWLGDLNFRISDLTLDAHKIQNMVQKGHLKELLSRDELNELKTDETAFSIWFEPEITFKPTYRMSIGSSLYDLRRRPAWTDRILYRSETGQTIDNLLYDSYDGFHLSDHKPVLGVYNVLVNTEKY